MEKKYYIKMTYTNCGTVYYKAHKKANGWYGKIFKDIAWKFSKAGAKKIIARYEAERDNYAYRWRNDAIWELEEAET